MAISVRLDDNKRTIYVSDRETDEYVRFNVYGKRKMAIEYLMDAYKRKANKQTYIDINYYIEDNAIEGIVHPDDMGLDSIQSNDIVVKNIPMYLFLILQTLLTIKDIDKRPIINYLTKININRQILKQASIDCLRVLLNNLERRPL